MKKTNARVIQVFKLNSAKAFSKDDKTFKIYEVFYVFTDRNSVMTCVAYANCGGKGEEGRALLESKIMGSLSVLTPEYVQTNATRIKSLLRRSWRTLEPQLQQLDTIKDVISAIESHIAQRVDKF